MENVNECKQGGVGIPKIIHYCWFGGGKKLPLMKHCLKSWRKVMPDYEIKCWDASTLDMTIPFIREAYKRKKWAFLTDYMRFYILWKEGGIYMDLDVEAFRPFDDFLNSRMFSGIDYCEDLFLNKGGKDLIDNEGLLLKPFDGKTSFGIAIEAAVLGAEKGHPLMKACIDYYNTIPFVTPEGNCFEIECPVVLCQIAMDFGFRYKNDTQSLREGICFYKYPTFANPHLPSYSSDVYACHWWMGTWRVHEKRRFVSNLLFPYRSYNIHYECVNISSYQRFIYRIVDYLDRKIVGIKNVFN